MLSVPCSLTTHFPIITLYFQTLNLIAVIFILRKFILTNDIDKPVTSRDLPKLSDAKDSCSILFLHYKI